MLKIEKKTIKESDYLSVIFYNARKKKKLSISDISAELLIHPKYLRMLETGDYANFPTNPYDYQFVKKYASYLGLDVYKMWRMFQMERKIYNELLEIKKGEEKSVFETKKKSFWYSFFNIPKLILNTFSIILLLFALSYFVWTFYGVRKEPYLEIYSPKDNLITENPNLKIEGKTDIGAELSINGKFLIVNNADGSFSTDLHLHDGINLLKIVVGKKQHKDKVIYKQIMLVNKDNISKK